ncbi:SDR family oxidoreductase [Streptomyces diastatochromogenes]|uniref:Short-chain dehydrogenase n=1 Tax=Streptomyces diastatochromogenes TaxID=42236 RepID=A0A233RZ98_STRDA|nr:SDR family oxidoreductase [Streptomyces diastatochromogenes]MCZ0991276.1 SDR family oxidoreductase [Streptomyces diastatochromogenes]OXY88679.1 short-chain dehydrogenase [Streptomyces diastatochromogenes]
MEIKGSVAVVTGANKGIGLAFTRALLARGAAKVYAGVRNPEDFREPGAEPLRLDVTDEDQIAAAAATASDATILINNAGIQVGPSLLEGSLDGARRELEVNYLGTWAVSRAFAPVLAAGGGGALVNMLSVASWRVNERWPGYAASKAAEWSLTNALRVGLRPQGTLVVGVHVGPVDTEATMGLDVPKVPAAEVAAKTLDAISRGETEVLVDEASRQVRAALSGPVELLEPAP